MLIYSALAATSFPEGLPREVCPGRNVGNLGTAEMWETWGRIGKPGDRLGNLRPDGMWETLARDGDLDFWGGWIIFVGNLWKKR